MNHEKNKGQTVVFHTSKSCRKKKQRSPITQNRNYLQKSFRILIHCIINQMIKAQKINQSSQQNAESRRRYSVIDYQTRQSLIKLVIQDGWSVADACRRYNVKMTTGCLIVRNYRNERRIFRKPGMGGPTNQNLKLRPQNISTSRNQGKGPEKRIEQNEPSPIQTARIIPSEPQIKVENTENTEIRYLEFAPNIFATQSSLSIPSFPELSYQLCYIPNWNIFWQ